MATTNSRRPRRAAGTTAHPKVDPARGAVPEQQVAAQPVTVQPVTVQPVSSQPVSSQPVEFHRTLLRFLKMNRLVDDRLGILYKQNEVVGGVYSSRGQEGISVASTLALGPEDYVGPLIRNLGSVLVKGIPPRDIFSQYMARSGGPTRGRDLNLHFTDLPRKMIGPISMLGSVIPVMIGIGLAARAQGQNAVVMTYIGDGGSSTGECHEALNYAAVMKAPLVLFIENNQWAYSTPTRMQTACTEFVDRAVGYGVHGESVDGNDVLAVYEITRRSVERARAGLGTTIIEAHTMRMQGHAAHDDHKYVPRELLAEWAMKDPIDRYVSWLLERRLLTAAEIDGMEAELLRYLDDEVEAARNSPPPESGWAPGGVFA